MLAEPDVARVQAPPRGGLPARPQLEPPGVGGELVGEHERAGAGHRLEGAQVIVDVVEGRRVHQQVGRRLEPQAQLVGQQLLGDETAVAAEHGAAVRREEDDVLVETGGRAHGPRDRAPQGVPVVRGPGGTDARLHLQARVVVVLELRAEGQAQAVRHQRDLVLHEGADEVERTVVRDELHHRAVGHLVAGDPGAEAPDHVLPPAHGETVLKSGDGCGRSRLGDLSSSRRRRSASSAPGGWRRRGRCPGGG